MTADFVHFEYDYDAVSICPTTTYNKVPQTCATLYYA